jgi:hypothetical protein
MNPRSESPQVAMKTLCQAVVPLLHSVKPPEKFALRENDYMAVAAPGRLTARRFYRARHSGRSQPNHNPT